MLVSVKKTHSGRVVGKPEVIDGPRGQVLVSRITGHVPYQDFTSPVAR